MAWKPDYITASELKSYLGIGDTADDAELAFAISATSRAIDQHCGRQFGKVPSAVARYYGYAGERIEGRPALVIDDVHTETDLAVVTLDEAGSDLDTVTAFDPWPWNWSADSRPFTHLVIRPTSSNVPAGTWPSYARGVKVTAQFGWASVPATVEQAALIQASRLFTRRVAPFGVAGSPDLGNELRLLAKVDPDVEVLLSDVRRPWGAA